MAEYAGGTDSKEMITLEEPELVWPMGRSDQDPSPADRPLVFNPKGS
jgi:hypothetical protein